MKEPIIWKEYEQEIVGYFRSEYPVATITPNARLLGRFSKIERQIGLLDEMLDAHPLDKHFPLGLVQSTPSIARLQVALRRFLTDYQLLPSVYYQTEILFHAEHLGLPLGARRVRFCA